MTFKLKTIFFIAILFLPVAVLAHQPRLVKENIVEVEKPMISQAFFGDLEGGTTTFRIVSDTEFNLYVGLLLPDVEGVDTNIFAKIYKKPSVEDDVEDNNKVAVVENFVDEEVISILDGSTYNWTKFYEKFAGDNYLWGPEFASINSSKKSLEGVAMMPGEYFVDVYSDSLDQKYILTIGEEEIFDASAVLLSTKIVPQIKKDYFGLSFLGVFSGYMAIYFIVPLAIIVMFLSMAVVITISQVRDKYKHSGRK
ncbi:MAG: hypothetical protein Q8P20_09395 [bacterium]|nr:hypothetical protein [bacterium]